MSRVWSTVPLAGLPLTSAGHWLFLPLNDPEVSMFNATTATDRCRRRLSAVPCRCPSTLSLPLKSAAVAATTQRNLSRSTSSFSG